MRARERHRSCCRERLEQLVRVRRQRRELQLGQRQLDAAGGVVKVNGTNVTLTFENLTRKTSFTKTLTMAAPDVSSAEWIAEAPSACDTYGRCRQVTLTNFGKIRFTRALATAGGHTGSVTDPLWTATPIELDTPAQPDRFAGPSAGF
jgi:Peptidase A4 family